MAAVAFGPHNAVLSFLELQSRLFLSTIATDEQDGLLVSSVYFSYCGCLNCKKKKIDK